MNWRRYYELSVGEDGNRGGVGVDYSGILTACHSFIFLFV
jgi:hypothetical protein